MIKSKVLAVSLLTTLALCAGYMLAKGNYAAFAVDVVCTAYWVVRLIKDKNVNVD